MMMDNFFITFLHGSVVTGSRELQVCIIYFTSGARTSAWLGSLEMSLCSGLNIRRKKSY